MGACMNAKADPGEDNPSGSSGAPGRKPVRTEPLSPGEPNTILFQLASPSVTGFHGEYNDTVIKPSQSVMSARGLSLMGSMSRLDSARRPTLTYTSSLQESRPKFRVGNEVLCMTWNIHHDADCTPFDFYCDFRNLGLKERDAVSIEILWDVARVFFYPDAPSSVCTETPLKSIVPPLLVSPGALKAYCEAAEFDEKEAELVMDYPNTALHTFLMAHTLLEDTSKKRNKAFSFIKTHALKDKRRSSPLRPNYDPAVFKNLLTNDPKLLPVLILDSLHVLVIRFSHFLIDNQLRKAFSEFEPEEQTERVALFLKTNSPSDLNLPKPFCDTRHRLYEKWKSVFQNSNKIRQIQQKVQESGTDIVLLQRVTKGAFTELKSKFSKDLWTVIPEKFPDKGDETTCMCLRNQTISANVNKSKRIDRQNFGLQVQVADIKFFCGLASLTPGEGCGGVRKKEAFAFTRLTKAFNHAIIGGLFNEDLTAFENPVAQVLLRKLNGIDHTQEEPLAFSVNRTRTNLQFEIRRADKQDKGVQDGIFSTFPLVGEAFTDFQHSGLENPSDHGPVFQRILVQS